MRTAFSLSQKSAEECATSCTVAVAYQLSQLINLRSDNARGGTGLCHFIVKRL